MSLTVAVIFTMLTTTNAQNSAEKIIAGNQGLHIGGYGQIDFNLPTRDGTMYKNGTLSSDN